MYPTHFSEANLKLTAPPSMPECLPMSAHRYPPTFHARALPEGVGEASICEPGGLISRWEPLPDERAAIAAGGAVWVYVVGDGSPPPIAVSGVSPFTPPGSYGTAQDEPGAICRPGVEPAGGFHVEQTRPGGMAEPTTTISLTYGGNVTIGERTTASGALVTVLKTGAAGAALTRQDAFELANELRRRASGEKPAVATGLDPDADPSMSRDEWLDRLARMDRSAAEERHEVEREVGEGLLAALMDAHDAPTPASPAVPGEAEAYGLRRQREFP